MPTFTFRRQMIVEWGQCDPAGIVFNARFFEFFDQNTWLLFDAALGVKPHDLAATFGIIGIAAGGRARQFPQARPNSAT